MTTNYYPSNSQWVGWAAEVTYGTAIAAPTVWIPTDTPVWVPVIAPLSDEALRGFMGTPYQQQQGLRYDTLTYTTYFYMDSVYQHFLAALGVTDTITGTADPYTHKTALLSSQSGGTAQPRSATLFWVDSAGKAMQMPGAQLKDLKVSLDPAGLAKLDISWVGLPSAIIAETTNTPTTQKPMPSWNSTITVGGTVMSKYSAVNLAYARNTEMIPTITGTQTPFAIFCGPLAVTGDFTGVYQGSTDPDFAAYLANTQPALLVKIAPPGDATHSLTLQHSVVAFDTSSPSGTNKWTELKSTFKCLMNSTDAIGGGLSPAQAIFVSAQSTAY